MRFAFTLDKKIAVVFEDEIAADGWNWLFGSFLRRTRICFNGYYNAYHIT